ncbi:hypothetical protein P691DRAFT_735541 [Macrolepiota fuliginosa MF-IS2]|uniref:DUF1793-domain-containing protein n=1 Tax=Macrolepiota fuliginosa MF-IS2 TaxID=1400762 RepID=A0A9P5X5W9_9AGAR|nr:hypothetical protein P691DRAFT_735541 [Macrolepiota fuliginosa MF-IS2]
MLSILFLQVTLFYGLLVSAQSSFPLGYIPLAVKTPYLNGWIASDTGASPAHNWPNFFTTDRTLGWGGMIRVDNQAFQWMGDSGFNFTKTLVSEISPTKSVFRLQAGPMQFNVTFFTPIEPTDYVRQSTPFSYMFVDAFAATDAQAHNVQVYTDISAEWVTRDDTQVVVWNTTETDTMVYHNVTKRSPSPMTENGNIAEDSVAYYAMAKRSGFTWRSGADVDCRKGFAANGTLPIIRDNGFRPVSQSWPVFAFSVDLGTVSSDSQPEPVVVALGLVRDPLISYATDTSVQSRSGYYWSAYSSIDQVISTFLSDFSNAMKRSLDFDNKVVSAAAAVSSEYVGIISLVTRQIFAAMDITIPSAQPGQFSDSDVKIFVKDMGVSLRASPVEVIYGAFPALLYFNPSLARDLLAPLLDFQSSSHYKNPYAAPDLGTTYPVILGNTSDTQTLGVESCGNMLIMAYAHAVKSGDGSLLSRYYTTFQSWANFLIENSLDPRNFITADGLSNPDMSNLALKGILGIYSMAKISEAVKVSNSTYMDQATQLISSWKQRAVANDHIDAVYGQSSSWGLMYNIFPAIWLNTGLIENSTLNLQAGFYAQQSSSDFGLSLDSSQQDVAYPHWSLMTAATVPDSLPSVQSRLIRSAYLQAYRVANKFPLPIKYKASTGDQLGGIGSAIQGAAFGMISLSLPNVNINVNSVNSPSGSTKSTVNVGAIVGGVLGGLAFLLILFAGGIFWRKRQQKRYAAVTIDDDAYAKPRPFNTAVSSSAPVVNYHPNDPDLARSPPSPSTTSPGPWTPPGWDGVSQPQQPGSGTDTTPDSLPVGAAGAMSNKQREALGLRANQNRARVHNPTPSESAVSTLSNPYSAPGSQTEELRAEVEQLRREMANIRHMAEPPPGYT